MDTLASDLRQAASDLLDIPVRQGPTLTHASPLSTGRAHDSVEDQDPASVSKAKGVQLGSLGIRGVSYRGEQGSGAEPIGTQSQQNESQVDLAASLTASTIDHYAHQHTIAAPNCIAPFRSHTPALEKSPTTHWTDFELGEHLDVTASARNFPPKSALFQRVTASAATGARDPRLDVWLNEKGERVVDGKVIGRLTLARARAEHARWEGDLHYNRGAEGKESVDSGSLGSGSAPYTNSSDVIDTATRNMRTSVRPSRDDFDHSRHGIHMRNTTPAFFVRSFPHAVSCQASVSDTILRTQRGRDEAVESHIHEDAGKGYQDADEHIHGGPAPLPKSSHDLHASTSAEATPSAIKNPSMLRLPGISDGPIRIGDFRSNLLRLHSATRASQLSLSDETSGESAMGGLSDSAEVMSLAAADAHNSPILSAPLTTHEAAQGIAWESWERLARAQPATKMKKASAPTDSRPLLDRATSFFGTQNGSPTAEREESAANADGSQTSYAETLWQSRGIHYALKPDAQLQPTSDTDAASLYSLPPSSITGSNSDAASRRPSLRQRTPSNSSLLSNPASKHGSPFSSTSPRRPRRPRSMSTETFTRDVGVRAWTEVGSRTRGYVIFEIVLLTAQSGVTIRAHRRYSSFVALKRQLATEAPQFASALPPLPPKDLIHKYSPKHLERRRIALTKWLQLVLLDPRWGGRKAAREWLVGAA